VSDAGRALHVVDLCGLAILEKTRVSGMPGYPDIAQDYERTFRVLRQLPVDIFIGAHPAYYGGLEKLARLKANPAGPNPFIDAGGFRQAIDAAERKFRDQLAREKK
jgi:metallo-beta-lactamase class B